MECSVSGDVSRYLNALYDTYDRFDVRQTTVGVDREALETFAERPEGIAVRVGIEGEDGRIVCPDGDDWALPGGVFASVPGPDTLADAAERWTGVRCSVEGLDRVSIVSVRREGEPELWTVSAVFSATAVDGSPQGDAVWREREAPAAAPIP